MPTTLVPSVEPPFTQAGSIFEIAPDVGGITTLLVNLYMIGQPGISDWVLVDAGIPMFSHRIIQAAAERFGLDVPPKAIILTHGHFDHVGSLSALLEKWPVPVYAHPLELPYLTGQSDYPPPDPTVGGGLMARSGFLFPHHAYDFRPHIHPLPEDHSIPELPNWRWIHTPGHSPGHVSLYRERDGVLLAGDAFITQKQESLWGVLSQHRIMHGPPAYFTIDWPAARQSVRDLAKLEITIAGTGHGLPIAGMRLQHDLQWLADEFDRVAVPPDGRYVRQPARTGPTGVIYLPPPRPTSLPKVAAALAVGITLLAALSITKHRD